MHSSFNSSAKIKSVYTIGKESPTHAEKERTAVILSILQGDSSFFKEPIVRKVLLPPRSSNARHRQRSRRDIPEINFSSPLNESQLKAVQLIMSSHEDDRVCVIHGPPGTGKTTVIAAAVINMVALAAEKDEVGFWLVAQSNVAVKNIAEKLASVGFLNFKLLVSMDFHFDW